MQQIIVLFALVVPVHSSGEEVPRVGVARENVHRHLPPSSWLAASLSNVLHAAAAKWCALQTRPHAFSSVPINASAKSKTVQEM